jgi:hypothetical protein
MAIDGASVWIAIIATAGAIGVGFYGYSSYRIGQKFGKWGAPYFAVYAVLLIAALTRASDPDPISGPVGVAMSLVSWALYTQLVLRRRIVRAVAPVRYGAVVLGLLALVVFPLLPQAAAGFALLYHAGAVTGWLAGARVSGRQPPQGPPSPAP